jgi:hypothetical protein
MKHFTIDAVRWYEGKGVTYDTPSRFRALVDFLKSNSLVRPGVRLPAKHIPPAFELRTDHLTDEGLALLKAAYHRWMTAIDRGTDPTDVSTLERALKKMRASAGSARSAK